MGSRQDFLHALTVGSLTLASRLLGLVRDVACAGYFGAGPVWDAFSFAFRVPNLFRRLFGEGALSAAFIPVFTEHLQLKGPGEARRLACVVATAVGAVLLACLLLGEGLLMAIPRLCAIGERWRLTLALSAVLLPYMLFICLAALTGAVLNSLKHFTAPALSPVVLNVYWIAAVVVVGPAVTSETAGRAFVLAVGILAAGVTQLALQLAVLKRKGMGLRPRFEPSHPGLRRTAALMAPVAVGMAAFQVNALLDGVIAISLSSAVPGSSFRLFGADVRYPMVVGANSVLYYGSRLMQFPLGVFGLALATAFFPTFSARAAQKDRPGFSSALGDALGAALFIGLPAGAGLMVLGRPAVELIFERGAFTPQMSARTSLVLAAYGAGVWAYCCQHVLVRAFYALQDSATPARLAAGAVALNLALNLSLIWPLAEAGLAAATALSAAAQTVGLYLILERRAPLTGRRSLLRTLMGSLLATGLMAVVCVWTLQVLPQRPVGDRVLLKLLRLAVPVVAGGAAYIGCAAVLGVPEMKLLMREALGRLRRSRTG